MSSLKYILDNNNEDEYHPASYTDGSSSHGNTSTLVYRGSNSKPSKSSKSSGGGSSSSSKPSGSSSKSSHHHSSKSKSSGKGKHKAVEDDDIDETYDYDYDQSSAQYTMDPGAEYGTSSGGQYYQQPHHGHGHHGSSRGGRGGYYMDTNAGAGYGHMQSPPIIHNSGVAISGSYDATAMHHYGAMPGMDSSAMAHGDMTGFSGMAGFSSQQEELEYTPVTRRMSRARKGKPVHFCDMCEPRRDAL
ncbi:hypothetical protein Sste5346_000859 [Sporothrix stenoceras]|uniref:Uncharacterized protein n=1 Tax=Sporothrix stenoceras TaxID=5173 RepID=A0ABR3ZRR3_9PEZI